jgi:hypothetical protein
VAENERYENVRKSRFFWHWIDGDGALRGEFKLTPDDGARLLSAVERRANELFDQAREAGEREAPTAYCADALVDLVTRCRADNGARVDRGVVLHVRVDAAALRRGHVKDGEVCEIPGVGPVPVSTARSLLPESFVKLLVTEGVNVATVCHIGRSVPAHLRSAIEERDRVCVVPGCDVAAGLEIDHWETDFALGGETSLANLARLCHYHHAMKTYQGFQLRGGPGNWEWARLPDFDTS